MKKVFNFLMVGLVFSALNIATVEAIEPALEADEITLGEGVQPVGADDQGHNPLESNQNTAPVQSTGMSEIVDSSGGGANLSGSDRSLAAVDESELRASRESQAKAERIAAVQKCIDEAIDSAQDSGQRIFNVGKCDPTAVWKGQDENGRHIYIPGPGVN